MKPWLVLVLLTAISSSAIADTPDTGEPVLILELAEKGVLEISLNSMERPTLVVEARHGGAPIAADFEVLGESFAARELLLQFYPCRKDDATVEDTQAGRRVVLSGCHPTIQRAGEARGIIVTPPRAILVDVAATVGGEAVSRTIKIELNRRYFDLGWSGGYMVSDHRDERYRIVQDDHGERIALALDEASSRRSFVALGTLSLVRARLFGLSFGLGTSSADLDEVAILAGASFTFRMRKAIDAVVLTVGGAYGPALSLRPEFRAGGVVPAELEAVDLLASEHEFKPFIALSFRTSGDGGVRQRLGGGASE